MNTTLSNSFFLRWCPEPSSCYDLNETYAKFNSKYFNGDLPVLPEGITRIKWEGRYTRKWGTYSPNGKGSGQIKLARRCMETPFQTYSTLLHEMVHAWLDLKETDDGIEGHGLNFVLKSKEINEKCEAEEVGYRVYYDGEVITQEAAEFQVPLLMSSFTFDDLDVAKKVESIINGAFAGSYEYSQ